MEYLSIDFKNGIADKLKKATDGKPTGYYRSFGVSEKMFQAIRLGKVENLMTDGEWLRLDRKLGVTHNERKWNAARTDVFTTIEDDILFCKQYAKAKICVDECGIGKTFTAKYLAKTLTNCFYVDASQGKSIQLLTRLLAQAIGLQSTGKYFDVKEDIKCYLKMIDKPIVIIDEAGDLSQNTLQEIKEMWNATEGFCAWYLMGADGLKYIIDKGIKQRRPGFKELFSRFSESYTTTVPSDKKEKLMFYKKLITDVLKANNVEPGLMDKIVSRCLIKYADGAISGLRRAESLLILYGQQETNINENDSNTEGDSIEETESEAALC